LSNRVLYWVLFLLDNGEVFVPVLGADQTGEEGLHNESIPLKAEIQVDNVAHRAQAQNE
jgi:hypothetical protein